MTGAPTTRRPSDDIPSIGNPDLLREHRIRRDPQGARLAVAADLRQLADWIAHDELAAGSGHAAITIVFTDDAPVIAQAGTVTWADYDAAREIVDDARSAQIRVVLNGEADEDQPTIPDRVEAGHRRRQRVAAAALAAEAERRAMYPWQCEHPGCPRRFRTERGAEQHERQCYRRPA